MTVVSETVHPESSESHLSRSNVGALALGALGVVYGDIGTSPLYALKECLSEHYGLAAVRDNVLGLLSLMTWSLTVVVTVKYLAYIMRAENRGEGGILALLALCPRSLRTAKEPGKVTWVTGLVIFGAALLYGDGMITPAISVLSAVEGLRVATHELEGAVLPVTCGILVALFAVQRHGTAKVGSLFGPIMGVWFLVLASLGARQIIAHPDILVALSPHHAVRFLSSHGFTGFAVLGSVVLCVTGGEALYADMGHFGPRPIRIAWLAFVMPALLLAYFGQGAHVLAHPEAAANPFFSMVPQGPATFALAILAMLATVIASQALITGAFSLTHQAVQLGLFPRVTIRHTSEQTEGQIYLPQINWLLAVACIALVLGFKSSSGLAAAYGIAVCGTMAITSIVFTIVARERWNWPYWKCAGLLATFLTFDLGFLASNLLKFSQGGYVPIVIAVMLTFIMATWFVGRSHLGEHYAGRSMSWETFKEMLEARGVTRSPCVGVFMASDARGVPPMIVHQAERIAAVPATAILMTVHFEHVPWVKRADRLVEVKDLGDGFYRVVARYGFMQQPEAPLIVSDAAEALGLRIDVSKVTYFLGRESFVASAKGKMGPVRENVFGALSRNATPATAYFQLPAEQVIEIGLQIDL